MFHSRDIGLLRCDVAAVCQLFLERCEQAGLCLLVTDTVRDDEYQAWLYASGRTRPGPIVTNSAVPTFHAIQFGLAFDFCKNLKGHEYDDPAFFRSAAAIGKQLGFEWGGDWVSFPDMPHLQWSDGGRYSSSDLLAGRTPPPMPLPNAVSVSEYQAIIQEHCHFSNPEGVWTVLDTHKYADDLYRKWADSYDPFSE